MEDWCIRPLAALGENFSGAAWKQAVELASQENEWFTPRQVEQAVEALRSEMLPIGRLQTWLAPYPKPAGWSPKRVGIVMAGNLPLVGFADLAAVVAVGHKAVVKLSSKDRALMERVVRELQTSGCPIEIVPELIPEEIDAVIATGSDTARDFFRTHFYRIPTLLRGNRQSAAILTGDETPEEKQSLGRDMFLYWGLGCRSVTRLFVPQGFDAKRFVQSLSAFDPLESETQESPACLTESLSGFAGSVKYTECYRYAKAIAAMGEGEWTDGDFFVLRKVDFSDDTAPKLAEILYSEYADLTQVANWLQDHAGALQCLSGRLPFPYPVDFPRFVAFGQTQYPRWRDYADGIDTVDFLLGL